MSVFQDIEGQELAIGDVVATLTPRYRDLTTAQIIGFTPQKVRVQQISGDSFLQESRNLVKIDPKNFFYRLLKKKA
jgi:hypothetical protein